MVVFGLLLKICNILEVTPNYIFETLFDYDNSKQNLLSDEILIKYYKLSSNNRQFINSIINHIYNIQKRKQK